MARNATLTILLGVLAAAAVMLALGGCSGAGSGTPAASGASVSAVVTDQLTGALTVRRWLNVMYRGQGGSGVKPAAVKPALAKSGQVGPRQTIAFEDSGTNSDGSTWHYPIFRTLPVGVSCRWVTMDFGWRYVR